MMNLTFVAIILWVLGCGYNSVSACDPKPMIIANEGSKACMYLDVKQLKTIGVGFNMQQKSAPAIFKSIGADFERFFNGPLSPSSPKIPCNCSAVPCLKDAQVNELLGITLKTAIADAQRVIRTFSSLCCPVQNTMVDMSFTLGGPGFSAFTTFANFINREYWKIAGDDLTVSKWCNAPHQDTKRCLRDAAIVSKGCGCSGSYPQVCTPTASSCCGSQETCCKAVFTYKGFITKTFNEVACCPFPKATCCTHNRCCRSGGICCPAAPAEPTFCCPLDYPHCLPNTQCSRGDHVIEGMPIHYKMAP